MKKYILLIIVVIGCFLSACYEDLGNYDYKEIPTVAIKDYHKDFSMMVAVGDIIHIEPILEYTLDSTAFDLEFEWYVSAIFAAKKKIGEEKKLSYKVDTAGSLMLTLFIKDKNTGVVWSNSDAPCRIYARDISSNAGLQGWYVLSEEEGSSCLSFIALINDEEQDKKILDETKNIYEKINDNEKLGGQPIGLTEHWLEEGSISASSPEQLLILQNGGIGPVYIDAQTFEKSLPLKDVFINGTLPAVTWKQACANPLNHLLLTDDGDLYAYGVEDPNVWFSGKFMDMPIQISGGMKISHMIRSLYNSCEITLFYDEKNHRFVWINSSEYEEASNLNIVLPVEENPVNTTMSINEPDIDILYIGGYRKKSDGSGYYQTEQDYLIIYKDKRPASETYGQYCLLNFSFKREPPTFDYLASTFWERSFPRQDMICEKTIFCCLPNSSEYLMYTNGPANNELWGYIFGNEGLNPPVRLYDFGNDPIVYMSAEYSLSGATDLCVATQSGKIYIFSISGESFRGDIIPTFITKESYGKVKEIRPKLEKGNAV